MPIKLFDSLNVDPALNRQRIAYHEAGHAVVGCALGLGVKIVAIVGQKDGYSDHSRAFEDMASDLGDLEARFRGARIQAAGGWAQIRWKSETGWFGCEEDSLKIIVNVNLMCELCGENDRSTWRSKIDERTKLLVEQYWPAIETVAQQLLERSPLGGDEVVAIIEAAVGEISG